MDGYSGHRTRGHVRTRTLAAMVPVLVMLLLAGCGSPASPAVDTKQYNSPAQIRAAGVGRAAHPPSDGIVSGPLRAPGGPYLYDNLGRIITLHGVDAVYKHPPYELYPDPGKPWNFTNGDARKIAGLGFTVVRLGILWQGIEPGTGGPNNPATCAEGSPHAATQFNRATVARYLSEVTRTVNLLGRYHVYTLLDMHQDVFNQAFRGEGVPAWAVCTDGQPIVPLEGRWSHNYRSPTLAIAESHFWLNNVVGDLQGQFDQTWAMVARHFAHNRWIVGYDPYNEPYSPELSPVGAQTFAVDLECFYTGRAHPGTLDSGHTPVTCPSADPAEGVVPRIEAADPHHLVFVEPDNFVVGHALPSLLGRMDLSDLVYNFHAYCGFRSPVTGDPTNLDASANQVLRNMSTRQRERASMSTSRQPGGPAWFMSEFARRRTQSSSTRSPDSQTVLDSAGASGAGSTTTTRPAVPMRHSVHPTANWNQRPTYSLVPTPKRLQARPFRRRSTAAATTVSSSSMRRRPE